MDEDFSPAWQARLGARMLANSLEIQLRREEAERNITEPVALGRYLIRSRKYAEQTQRDLSQEAEVSPLQNFLKVGNALGRLFPLGFCPHDHACGWQPIRPPQPRTSDTQRYIDQLRREAGEVQ